MSSPYTFGLIGKNISHSLSPGIFEHIFALTGERGDFRVLDFPREKLASELDRCRGWDGFSVTIPYKGEIIRYLGEIDEMAKRIGAVNSVRVSGGRFFGHNTDVPAFKVTLEEMAFTGRRFLILGTGGAARAVFYALATGYPEASITVSGRREGAIKEILELNDVSGCANGCNEGIALYSLQADDEFDLIVNCTPVGGPGSEGESPLPESFQFRGCDLCYDLIYWPDTTALLAAAQKAGCRTIGGLPMLVRQAVESYMLWTGHALNAVTLSAEVLARLKQEGKGSIS